MHLANSVSSAHGGSRRRSSVDGSDAAVLPISLAPAGARRAAPLRASETDDVGQSRDHLPDGFLIDAKAQQLEDACRGMPGMGCRCHVRRISS